MIEFTHQSTFIVLIVRVRNRCRRVATHGVPDVSAICTCEKAADEIALCRPGNRIQLSVPGGRKRIAPEKDSDVINLISNYMRRIYAALSTNYFHWNSAEIKIKQRIKHYVIKNASKLIIFCTLMLLVTILDKISCFSFKNKKYNII